jgi:hypothetical protein
LHKEYPQGDLWVPILMGTHTYGYPYLWVPILMGTHTYGYPYDFYKFYLYPCTVVKKKILTYLCLNFVQIMVLIL